MKRVNRFWLLLLLCVFYFTASAQIEQYNYKRPLQLATGTWQKIVLPNDVFGKISPGMDDLRIFGIAKNGDTITAPYILSNTQAKKDDKEAAFKLINQATADGGFYYSFEMAPVTAINEINLNFSLPNFDCFAKLQGSEDRQHWFTLLDQYRLVAVKNQFTDYQFTKLVFNEAKYHYFRLFVNTRTNPGFESAELILQARTKDSLNNYRPQQMLVQQQKKEKQTVLDIDLGLPLPVNKLKLFVHDEFDYYRPVSVEYLTDSFKTTTGWHYNYQQSVAGTLTRLEKNEISFSPVTCRRLRISINNADNTALQIDSCIVSTFQYYLLARFTQPADYYLVYGNTNASKPDYDIEHFTNNIPAVLPMATAGNEEPISKQPRQKQAPLFQNKAWLWGLMIVIILLLGGFSYSMLKKSS